MNDEPFQFESPGEKIKTVANWLFWLGCISVVICAFVFGKDKRGDFDFWSFIIIALCGGASVYVSTLITYGIGTAIECIETMAKHTYEVKKNTAEIIKNTANKE